MAIATLLILLFVLILIVLLFLNYRYKYWKRRGVPYLKPKLFLGNMETFTPEAFGIGTFAKVFYDGLKLQGTKIGGAFLYTQPCLVINDPDYIKDILTKDFAHFVDRGFYYNQKDDPISAHLFSLDGASWKSMRTKLTPTFTSGKMKMMLPLIIDCSNYMINFLKEKNEIDVREVMACFTTDVIGSCAFGIKCNSFLNPNAEFRTMGKKLFEPRLLHILKNAFILAAPNLAKKLHIITTRKDAKTFFTNVIRETIEMREANTMKSNDFLQLLMEIRGDNFGINEMTAQTILFFIAGFDTSSTAMTFVLYELAKEQNLQDRLRDEINEFYENNHGNLTYEGIMEMKYLDQVVNETLRMYPPLPSILRRCTKKYNFKNTNITIEKGTPIVISTLGIHRDPDYYPDPDNFDPERFNETNKANRHPFHHIPFGDGPRNCIGLRFGLMQTKIGIVTILNNFRVKVSPKTKPVELNRNVFLLKTYNPIYLKIERIK